jgi:chemotaxis signal transduction protein
VPGPQGGRPGRAARVHRAPTKGLALYLVDRHAPCLDQPFLAGSLPGHGVPTLMTTTVNGIAFDPRVAPLVARMERVGAHRESLQRLQDVWDQLTLLGQISGIATDITGTADEFRTLTGSLLNALARRLLDNRLHRMRAQAQVAIDVLVRNLFERTADVGFLATDDAALAFLRAAAQGDTATVERLRGPLQSRLEAYVAKYSVYDDVILLSPDGRVQARLDHGTSAGASSPTRHPLAAQALQPGVPFVEHFGETALLDGRRGLLYAAAIRAPRGRDALGALALSFRFDDEMRSIFAHLAPLGPCSVVVLHDPAGRVLASSDPWQVPVDAVLPPPLGSHRLFFGGREYLAARVAATGYQGYPGPGWNACALIPLDQAFRADDGQAEPHGDGRPSFPSGTLDEGPLFTDEMGRILRQARRIQRGLERSVWNGEVRGRQSVAAASGTAGFGGALLQQITATGARIKAVMEDAIADLQQSAAASILDEVGSCASLAIDIMDRNLYERANDCRWWALDGVLGRTLRGDADGTAADAARVLSHINGLYTVYSTVLLLDAQGRIVAASNPDGERWVGSIPEAGWVRPALQLRDGQAHVRSAFEASPLYGGQMTYVYAAAVRAAAGDGTPLGAVAIVFDARPQFEAMLRDTLPRGPDGRAMPQAVGLFVTRAGLIVSSTDPQAHPVGQAWNLRRELVSLARGESRQRVLEDGASVFAAGIAMSRGYREYHSGSEVHEDDVACVVMVRVGQRAEAPADEVVRTRPRVAASAAPKGESRHLASFHCAGEWLAIDAGTVVEALDVPHLTALPNSPSCMAGVVMHGNAAVPVIDLRLLRNRPPAPPGHDGPMTVILCKGAGGQAAFGLRVDELGKVLEVATAAVRPIQGYLAVHDRHAEGVVSFGGSGQPASVREPMLIVLNAAGLGAGFTDRS